MGFLVLLSILHKDNSAVADTFVDVVVKLATREWMQPSDAGAGANGWVVVLAAMSGEDLARVQELFTAVQSKLQQLHLQSQSDERGGAVVLVRCVLDTAGLLSLYRMAHFSINYKLHGNVLSAAAGSSSSSCIVFVSQVVEADVISHVCLCLRYAIRGGCLSFQND